MCIDYAGNFRGDFPFVRMCWISLTKVLICSVHFSFGDGGGVGDIPFQDSPDLQDFLHFTSQLWYFLLTSSYYLQWEYFEAKLVKQWPFDAKRTQQFAHGLHLRHYFIDYLLNPHLTRVVIGSVHSSRLSGLCTTLESSISLLYLGLHSLLLFVERARASSNDPANSSFSKSSRII